MALMASYCVRLADVTLTDKMTLYVGDQTVEIFSVPGHSAGGIAVYLPREKVVFTTDIVFHKKMSWLPEATPSEWLASLKKLSELDVDVVIPGHGDPCTKEYFKEQAAIVQGWVERVQSAIKQGLTVEEAASKITTPDPYPKQAGTPFTHAEVNKATVTRLYSLYS
jgi:glyoxylase-like metal-dependent hydrolase (beta-lactamase superfamily II)